MELVFLPLALSCVVGFELVLVTVLRMVMFCLCRVVGSSYISVDFVYEQTIRLSVLSLLKKTQPPHTSQPSPEIRLLRLLSYDRRPRGRSVLEFS